MRNTSSISGTGHNHSTPQTKTARNFLGSSLRQLFTDPSREHKHISAEQEANVSNLMAVNTHNPPAS